VPEQKNVLIAGGGGEKTTKNGSGAKCHCLSRKTTKSKGSPCLSDAVWERTCLGKRTCPKRFIVAEKIEKKRLKSSTGGPPLKPPAKNKKKKKRKPNFLVHKREVVGQHSSRGGGRTASKRH